MTVNAKPDKLSLSDVPRMIGDSDVDLIRKLAAGLPENARIVEIGPFLGGVTQVLAEYGNVEVIDRFEWSDKNAESFPEFGLTPGTSFRSHFEQNLAKRNIEVVVHEAWYQDFQWPGAKMDFCFVDAPRNASGLLHCLKAVAHCWRNGTPLLLKQGLSAEYPELGALLEILIDRGVVRLPRSEQPRWSNVAVLYSGPNVASLAELRLSNLLSDAPVAANVVDPWGGRRLSAARLAQRIGDGDWTSALRLLESAPRDSELLYAWDDAEAALLENLENNQQYLAAFAELLAAQVNPVAPPVSPEGSLPNAMRAWWHNNQSKTRLADGFHLELLAAAFERKAMVWPSKLRSEVFGEAVLEIGSDLGLSAVGYLTVGVERYLGVSTGNLTSELMKLEAAYDDVTFMPLLTVKSEHVNGTKICLIHEHVAEHREVTEWIATIQPVLARGARMWVLSKDGTRSRPFKPRAGTN